MTERNDTRDKAQQLVDMSPALRRLNSPPGAAPPDPETTPPGGGGAIGGTANMVGGADPAADLRRAIADAEQRGDVAASVRLKSQLLTREA